MQLENQLNVSNVVEAIGEKKLKSCLLIQINKHQKSHNAILEIITHVAFFKERRSKKIKNRKKC